MNTYNTEYQPVIIIGAPRSGTNMLRDVLARMPGTGTWPCDEINYIWRHGNILFPSDEFTPEMARDGVRKYIRNRFSALARRNNLAIVIEKTCASSLRVDFVSRVIPNAKYIFIHRNGIDAVASAMVRWKADLDLGYILRKARYVPLSDAPYYAGKYAINRIYRMFSATRRVASWGPRLNGMQALLQDHSLEEVCALQWKRCVEAALDSFERMPKDAVLSVSYEGYVDQPVTETARIAAFLGMQVDPDTIRRACETISRGSVGKGQKTLADPDVARVSDLLGGTLQRLGYG